MPKSADDTAGRDEHLAEDSDVIELTDEASADDHGVVGRGGSAGAAAEHAGGGRIGSDHPATSADTASGVVDVDESSEADQLDVLTREMPEFRMPDDPDDARPAPSDNADDGQQDAQDDEVPASAILSGRKATVETDSAPVERSSDDQKPDDEYDREAMFKTIQMDAASRQEAMGLSDQGGYQKKALLRDHSGAPDVLVHPPRVLTKRWKDGGPLSDGAPAGDSSNDAAVSPSAERQPGPAAGTDPTTSTDPTTTTADTFDDDDVPEIDPDSVEIQLDDEPADRAPTQRMAADRAPTQEEHVADNHSAAHRSADRESADTETTDSKSASSRPPPQPSDHTESAADAGPTHPGDDDELGGLVQELLDESKPAPAKSNERPASESARQGWFHDVFSDEYLRTLPKGIHRQTQRDADFIEASFELADGDRLLDLACGFGRHAIELTRRGHEVAGFDLSMPLLRKALNEAKKQSLSIKFIHGDMRDLSFDGIFSGCFLWQTSFGYFDEQTNFRVLRGIHRSLRPGGRVLIDVLNRDHIVTKMPHRLWWEGVDCIFLEEVDLDERTSVLHTKRSFIYEDGTPPLEQHSFIRLYSLHELRRLMRAAGFEVTEVSGELYHRGQFLGSASSRIIIQAQKRPPQS